MRLSAMDMAVLPREPLAAGQLAQIRPDVRAVWHLEIAVSTIDCAHAVTLAFVFRKT